MVILDSIPVAVLKADYDAPMAVPDNIAAYALKLHNSLMLAELTAFEAAALGGGDCFAIMVNLL